MTDAELQELRELCEKATPAPWETVKIAHYWRICSIEPDGELFGIGETYDAVEDDAAFIVAAREAMPKLLDEVAELRGEVTLFEGRWHAANAWRRRGIDSLVAAESQALGFTTFMAGMLLPTVVAWLTSSTLSPTANAIYFAMTVIALVGTGWFGATWHRAKKERPRLLKVIRERCSTEVSATAELTSTGQPQLPPKGGHP